MNKYYTVSQDLKSKLFYVHKKGFPNIPCWGSFTENKTEAKRRAAQNMAISLKEYNRLKD